MSETPKPKSVLTPEQIHQIGVLQNLTVEHKASLYDILIENIVREGSYSVLAMGYATSTLVNEIVKLKAERKL